MTAQTEVTIDSYGLSQGAWLISRVELNYAAQTLEITATWDEDREFQLIFTGFHLIYWDVYDGDNDDPGTVSVDVIGMEIDENSSRKRAVLTTDLFEFGVSYSALEIKKAW